MCDECFSCGYVFVYAMMIIVCAEGITLGGVGPMAISGHSVAESTCVWVFDMAVWVESAYWIPYLFPHLSLIPPSLLSSHPLPPS